MSVRFLSTGALATLRQGIEANRQAYLDGNAAAAIVPLGPSAIHESRISAGEPPPLIIPEGSDNHDNQNVRLVHRWLGRLTPVQASDPRLWACLTHSTYAGYTARRWPIEADSKVADRIRDRYFVEGEGLASLTRNSLARLWWFGYLTHDTARSDPYELTDVLLSLQDIQQAFLERTLGRSRPLLHAALKLWKQRVNQTGPPPAQGRVVQKWARLIRLHGAVTLLDALPSRQLDTLIWIKLGAALNEDLPELDEEAEQS